MVEPSAIAHLNNSIRFNAHGTARELGTSRSIYNVITRSAVAFAQRRICTMMQPDPPAFLPTHTQSLEEIVCHRLKLPPACVASGYFSSR